MGLSVLFVIALFKISMFSPFRPALRTQQDEIIAIIREDNIPSWRAIEKAGFILTVHKMYQDIDDVSEQM